MKSVNEGTGSDGFEPVPNDSIEFIVPQPPGEQNQ